MKVLLLQDLNILLSRNDKIIGIELGNILNKDYDVVR